MTQKQRDQHKGARIDMRAPTPEDKARWRAAAKADGRTLTGWLAHLANTACQANGIAPPGVAWTNPYSGEAERKNVKSTDGA